MKLALVLICLFLSTSTWAAHISPVGSLARALASTKVGPCIKKLNALESKYDLRTSDTSVEVTKAAGNQLRTEVSYYIVQGGDQSVGEAHLIIAEKLMGQFGFPNVKIPIVTGCNIKIKMY